MERLTYWITEYRLIKYKKIIQKRIIGYENQFINWLKFDTKKNMKIYWSHLENLCAIDKRQKKMKNNDKKK